MLRFIHILLILFPFCAYANIAVSPFFIELDADSTSRGDQIRFTNTSRQRQTYNITMVNFSQNLDGKYSAINQAMVGNPFADSYLEWSPHQVSLNPGESQVIRIRRRGMAGASNGEYVSHLMIQEQAPQPAPGSTSKADGLNIELNAIYGITIPIMIEKGDVTATAKIQNVKLLDAGRGLVARVTVQRSGTRSFYGTLVLKNQNKEYGRVEKFRIFMTTPTRVIDIPLNSKPGKDAELVLIDEITNETLETKLI